jgi:hypothetical protein
MNLTLKRGPSVWDDRPGAAVNWRVAAAAGGLVITAVALSSRSRHSNWVAGLGLCGVAASLLTGRWSSTFQAGCRALRVVGRTPPDRVVDRASEDSFPASDPTAHSVGP